jgi:hypothetical protein
VYQITEQGIQLNDACTDLNNPTYDAVLKSWLSEAGGNSSNIETTLDGNTVSVS